jgi:large conductance mechanosensitive channel
VRSTVTQEVVVLQEFKDFINKGNVFDAAVGLIMALAFVPVVGSLVDDVIMPVVARVFGQPDFSALQIGLGGTEEVTLEDGTVVMREAAIRYGAFLNEIIAFVIIGFVIFMLVRTYNRATARAEDVAGPSEVELLTEIRDGLRG